MDINVTFIGFYTPEDSPTRAGQDTVSASFFLPASGSNARILGLDLKCGDKYCYGAANQIYVTYSNNNGLYSEVWDRSTNKCKYIQLKPNELAYLVPFLYFDPNITYFGIKSIGRKVP